MIPHFKGITMNLFNIFSIGRSSVLKAHNPRIGTSIIPIGINDSEILSQYLLNKVHSLHFEGSFNKLKELINKLAAKEDAEILKMRVTMGRRGQILLLHLRYPNSLEVRRVIQLN